MLQVLRLSAPGLLGKPLKRISLLQHLPRLAVQE